MDNSKQNNNLELDFERICFFYMNANTGYLGIFITIIFMGIIINELSTFNIALTWVIVVIATYIPRIILSINFTRKLKRQEIIPENIRSWENYCYLLSILPFIIFASVVFLPYGENELIGLLFCTVVIVILIAGGVILYSTSTKVIYLFMHIYLFSLIAKCFWIQEFWTIMLGFYLIFVYILMLRLYKKQYALLIENIALKIENENQSLTDPLTKLWNRRRLDLHIEKLVPSSKRSGKPFSLILLDIDHFKKYNDTNGHQAGDELLVKIAGVLLECSRAQDLVVRYGGEEFIVLLPGTSIKDSEVIADRIISNIRQKSNVTISAGLAEYNTAIDFKQLIHKADEALYTAKNSGRDRYVLAAT